MREIEQSLSSLSLSPEDRLKITETQKKRAAQCKDLYHNIAIEFAELHDMPGSLLILYIYIHQRFYV